MKKNESILGGQYWKQGERNMTATNDIIEGMPNTREAAILSAAVEAVEWQHPTEPEIEGKRSGRRVIIYLSQMPQLEEAMNAFPDNPTPFEDGSHIAFARILTSCSQFAISPRTFILRSHMDEYSSTGFNWRSSFGS
jgi:hypothetical protein